jgi:hypothetical protein
LEKVEIDLASNELEDQYLPALHNAASTASTTAQKRYIALFVINLFLLTLGTVVTAVSVQSHSTRATVATLAGITFTLSLIVTAAMGVKRYERTWYGGRAIAESVKTIAWKYMTGAEPYDIVLSIKDVDARFRTDLTEVLDQRRYLSGALQGRLSNTPQITQGMRFVRAASMKLRRDFYVKARIENQRRWYSERASTNQINEWFWFVAILAIQALAAASAFALVRWPQIPLRLSSVFATAAAGSIAWLQVRRHQELAQSYNLAAQELGLIIISAEHVDSDEELSKFVSDAESAVSREHTMWVARRDQA